MHTKLKLSSFVKKEWLGNALKQKSFFLKEKTIMKKRRTLIISMLLIAALCLGIGYAALTDTLDINGTVDVNQSAAEEAFDIEVYFSNAKANQDGNSASIVIDDPDMASFTITSLKGQDDYATFTFTIFNASDVDATVTPTLAADGNSNPEYFSIVSDWNAQPKVIKAGESMEYTVTVTLLKTPTETIHGAFHIELTAVAGE